MNRILRSKSLAAGLALTMAFTAAGCSKSKTTTTASGGTKATGTIKVCSDIPYKPMEYEGPGPRGLKYTGFDIELLDAMAQKLGRTIAVQDVNFDVIFARMAAGKCDVVGSSVSITPERQKSMAFTAAYFDADQSLLVKASSGVKKLTDLAGKTIGVQSKTTGQTYAEAHKPTGATVKDFADTTGLFGALEAGTIDGILQDLPVNAGRATEDKTVKVVETYKTNEKYGFAVAKDNKSLVTDLDKALADVRADGTYQKLYDKYFPKA